MIWHGQMKFEVTVTIIVDALLYVPSILIFLLSNKSSKKFLLRLLLESSIIRYDYAWICNAELKFLKIK